MAQSIFSNTIIATLGRAVTLVCGLASTALMARMLHVGGFGVYSLVLTIATMVQLFADFGLYLTLSRQLGLSQGKPNEHIANIVSLRIVLLLALFGLSSITLLSVPSMRESITIFLVFAVGLIFQSISQLLMGVFQAYGCIWRATLGDVIGRFGQLVALAIGFFLLPEHATLLWVASSFTGGLMLSCIVHLIVIPERRLLRIRASYTIWWHIIQISWPIALMLILNVIYFRIDTVLLSYLRSSQEVGLYSLAYKIIENGLFFPAMIGGLLLPAMSAALARRDHSKAQELIAQCLTLSFSGACILVPLLIVFSREIIELLASQLFAPSAALLRILAIALGIMCIGNIFGFSLIALGKQKALAALYGILAVGNIIANFMYIPLFGALGAAWVTVATELSATTVAGLMVYRSIPWRLSSRSIVWPLWSACIAVGIAILLAGPVPLLPRLCIAALVYTAMMYIGRMWIKITI